MPNTVHSRPGGVTGQYLGRDVPPGKSADFPGVVGNPLPLVRFRRKDRFSTPLVEKRPAPPTPWPGRSNFNFSKKSSTSHQNLIFHRGFTVTPCRLKAARHTPNNPRYSRDEPGTDCGHLGGEICPTSISAPPADHHRTPHTHICLANPKEQS